MSVENADMGHEPSLDSIEGITMVCRVLTSYATKTVT